MKRFLALFLALCAALSLAACRKEAPQPSTISTTPATTLPPETTEATQPETTAPETTAPAPGEDSLNDFLERTLGIWIFDGTIDHRSENGCSFESLMIRESDCTTAIYPGGYDGPGLYEGCTKTDNNTYKVTLFYKKGVYGGASITKDHRVTATFVLSSKDKIKVKFGDGAYNVLHFGGFTFDEAADTACRLVPYVPPTPTYPITITPATKVISEHEGYRIVREDRSGRNSAGQVVVEQYYDYVELTANTAVAKKINPALKPKSSAFQTEKDLADLANIADPSFPLQNTHIYNVTFLNDKWLCVTTASYWMMGGVSNFGNSALVFDVATGDRVTLRAFAGDDPAAFEAQIKQIVWQQIEPQGPWDNAYETLSKYTLDTFDFAIPNGQIVLYFPEYEFFSGAHGPVVIDTGLYIA